MKRIGSTELFELYPNPANNKANIFLNDPDNSEVTIVMMDMIGKKIYEERILNTSEKIKIDLRSLSKGIYLVEVTAGKKQEVKKLVID